LALAVAADHALLSVGSTIRPALRLAVADFWPHRQSADSRVLDDSAIRAAIYETGYDVEVS
jgi:hypothetical protein